MNYKSTQRKVTWGGLETTIPISATVVVLGEQTNSSSSADGMIKEFDNVVYAVTAGKTFHLLGISYTLSAGGGTIAVHEGDTENAQTVAKGTVLCGFTVGVEYFLAIEDETFASAKFITIAPSTTQVLGIRMIGFEI